MPEANTTRVKLATGGIELEYEGNESFLRSDLPKFVEAIAALRNPNLAGTANALQDGIKDFYLTMETMSDVITSLRADIDSMSEMGEMESLRLQMSMDRLSKLMSTLSNILKKMSDTSESIVRNLK
jgi:hypothetical protein